MTPIATRFNMQPVILSEAFDLEAFAAAFPAAMQPVDKAVEQFDASAGFWPTAGTAMARFRPYVVSNRTLTIPIQGVLLDNFPYQLGDMATGYEYVNEAVARASEDEDVDTILLKLNSPGGSVTECFETSDAIFAARTSKRIVAHVADSAYSAGYALASAASEIVGSRTSGAGSIGVITYHIDASEAYEKMGIKKTYVYKGKHKVEGRETEPLTKEARESIEARLSPIYDVFVSTVARNRGLDERAVRKTEAATYPALTAIEEGLIDRIGTRSDAILAASTAHSLNKSDGDIDMADANTAKVTLEDLEAAKVEARAEGFTAGKAEGAQEGALAERERIGAILTCDAAKDRPTTANAFAFDLGLSVEQATATLAKIPAETVAESKVSGGVGAPAGMMDVAMGNGADNLAADLGTGETDETKAKVAATLGLFGY